MDEQRFLHARVIDGELAQPVRRSIVPGVGTAEFPSLVLPPEWQRMAPTGLQRLQKAEFPGDAHTPRVNRLTPNAVPEATLALNDHHAQAGLRERRGHT